MRELRWIVWCLRICLALASAPDIAEAYEIAHRREGAA